MGKVIYVNGSIFVHTRFFIPKDIGCNFKEVPDGAIVVEATNEYNGIKCFLIDDEHPQSLFNEYYAKDDLVSDSFSTSYFTASLYDCVKEYISRIQDICLVVESTRIWDDKKRGIVFKMSYVSVLSALESFISFLCMRRCLRDENLFRKFMFSLAPTSKKKRWNALIDQDKLGVWEQDAIQFVLEKSFLNIRVIDDAFAQVGLGRIDYDRESMSLFFRVRHLIVHRSGKQMDDIDVAVTYDSINDLIEKTNSMVIAVYDALCVAIAEELKDAAPEPSIEEIFPGGLVSGPIRLSDLSRLLDESNEEVPTIIELPSLSAENVRQYIEIKAYQ